MSDFRDYIPEGQEPDVKPSNVSIDFAPNSPVQEVILVKKKNKSLVKKSKKKGKKK